MASVRNDKNNVTVRGNDDYTLTVNCPYDISLNTPKFIIKKGTSIVDWSSFITKIDNVSFKIDVAASNITMLAGVQDIVVCTYDCFMDFGAGSKDFLFGGKMTVIKGLQ